MDKLVSWPGIHSWCQKAPQCEPYSSSPFLKNKNILAFSWLSASDMARHGVVGQGMEKFPITEMAASDSRMLPLLIQSLHGLYPYGTVHRSCNRRLQVETRVTTSHEYCVCPPANHSRPGESDRIRLSCNNFRLRHSLRVNSAEYTLPPGGVPPAFSEGNGITRKMRNLAYSPSAIPRRSAIHFPPFT